MVPKVSHPGQVVFTALCIAQLKGMDVLEVIKASRENTKELYDWGSSRVTIADLRSSDSRDVPVTSRNANDEEDDTDEEDKDDDAEEEEEMEGMRKVVPALKLQCMHKRREAIRIGL